MKSDASRYTEKEAPEPAQISAAVCRAAQEWIQPPVRTPATKRH